MTLSERLKAARGALGLKQEEVVSKSGIPISTYRKYEGGTSEPGAQAIAGLIHTGINANWLLTGEGPMLLADLAADDPAALKAAQAKVAELEVRVQKADEERRARLELMRQVIQALEEELERCDVDIRPEGKAKVICILYDYAVQLGGLDAQMMRNVLALAA